jgi:flagellin
MLQRIRELAVEAGNSTLGSSDAQSVNAEITALQAEITRIATTTTFNSQNLLTGALSVAQTGGTANNGFVVQAGTNTSITNISVVGAKASTTYTMTSATGGAGTVTLSDGNGNSQTLTLQAIGAKGSETLNFGNLGVSLTVASVAGESAANVSAGLVGTGNTVITGAGSGATFQIGANAGDTLGVAFADARTSAYAGFDTAISNFTTAANSGIGIAAAAGALITATDTAIGTVSSIRANFGAVENRLNHTVASISVASENLNASESRIKDLDVAAEMVNFTKTQILQQAGTSILAQANQAPQNILTLLR